jgi:hypothetical protein
MIVLRKKIAEELIKLEELVNRVHRLLLLIQQNDDPIYLDGLMSGLALYIQNFYTDVERVFALIAKQMDGVTPSSADWHIQLLGQLLVPVPNIRPAIISQDTYEQLNEFRGFRHVSRNLYAYDLDHQRIIDLANKLIGCHQIFMEDMKKFDAFLANN